MEESQIASLCTIGMFRESANYNTTSSTTASGATETAKGFEVLPFCRTSKPFAVSVASTLQIKVTFLGV